MDTSTSHVASGLTLWGPDNEVQEKSPAMAQAEWWSALFGMACHSGGPPSAAPELQDQDACQADAIRHSTARDVSHAGLHRLTAVGVCVMAKVQSENASVLCVWAFTLLLHIALPHVLDAQ